MKQLDEKIMKIINSNPKLFGVGFKDYVNGKVILTDPSDLAIKEAQRDLKIFEKRQEAIYKNKNICIGDWVKLKNGTFERITVNSWQESVQVGGYENGSFHLFQSGNCNYSGGCGDLIEKKNLVLTIGYKEGNCWIFSNDSTGGNRAVYLNLNFKVWQEI